LIAGTMSHALCNIDLHNIYYEVYWLSLRVCELSGNNRENNTFMKKHHSFLFTPFDNNPASPTPEQTAIFRKLIRPVAAKSATDQFTYKSNAETVCNEDTSLQERAEPGGSSCNEDTSLQQHAKSNRRCRNVHAALQMRISDDKLIGLSRAKFPSDR
jgi:hypothetical protein